MRQEVTELIRVNECERDGKDREGEAEAKPEVQGKGAR